MAMSGQVMKAFAAGKKVRPKFWERTKSYIYRDDSGAPIAYCYNGISTKIILELSILLLLEDWEIVPEPKKKAAKRKKS